MMRKAGYYWVRIPGEAWEIGQFDGSCWWLCGSDLPFPDERFEEIGPLIERPQ